MASMSKTNGRRNVTTTNVEEMVVRGVSSIMERNAMWLGTMTDLTTALNRVLSRKQRSLLPGSPSALRIVINRVVNRLRNRGIGVRFGRTTDHSRTRFVRFAR
jgi:hypothetical protein